MIAIHLLIHGRVQGVGYRAWLAGEAQRRGIAGYTRNLASGEVEAVVAGPEEAVRALIAACRTGPIGARVDGIVETVADDPGPGFRVLSTR